MKDESRPAQPLRAWVPPHVASLYEDQPPINEDGVLRGRAGMPAARLCTFPKALLTPDDIREIGMGATAPAPGRYTPRATPVRSPRYSMAKAPRKLGVTRLQEQKLKDMANLGPGRYFPHDRATTASPRTVFFTSRDDNKPPR